MIDAWRGGYCGSIGLSGSSFAVFSFIIQIVVEINGKEMCGEMFVLMVFVNSDRWHAIASL